MLRNVEHPQRDGSTSTEVGEMAVFNAAFPILPGKLELAKAFGRDAVGPRRPELEDFQKRRGVIRETWSIQETGDGGGFSVVWIESPDPEKAIITAAEDTSEFGSWFRDRVKEINGIDLAAVPPAPVPTVTLDWSSPT
jgi:hypothetical protein